MILVQLLLLNSVWHAVCFWVLLCLDQFSVFCCWLKSNLWESLLFFIIVKLLEFSSLYCTILYYTLFSLTVFLILIIGHLFLLLILPRTRYKCRTRIAIFTCSFWSEFANLTSVNCYYSKRDLLLRGQNLKLCLPTKMKNFPSGWDY